MKNVERYCFEDWGVFGEYISAENFDRITTDLEQRRHAEQQACQAAERRVEELEGLLRRISKHYENSDVRETNRAIDEIEASLNPTAEAVSHDE